MAIHDNLYDIKNVTTYPTASPHSLRLPSGERRIDSKKEIPNSCANAQKISNTPQNKNIAWLTIKYSIS